jgi:CHAD domain-containing protein
MHRSSDASVQSASASTSAAPSSAASSEAIPAAGPRVLDDAAPPTVPVRSPASRTVVSAFSAAIDRALDAIVTVDRDPVAAVHELRRAVRTARAILRVVEATFPRTAALELRAALGSAIRETATMRDLDVLPSALAALPPRRETNEARAEVEALLLTGRAAARKRRGRARRLAVLGARLSLLAERFADLLPDGLERRHLSDGFARLARRGQRAVRGALRSTGDLSSQHLARKRVRDLAIALHALGGSNARVRRRAAKLARLSTKFGATLDLELLRVFVRENVNGLHGDSAERLLEQLKQKSARRRPRLLKRARRWLAPKRWKEETLWASNVA